MTMPSWTTVICSVCGNESTEKGLLSTNTMGYMDLDTRPAEMQRSTMDYWINECPHCGYVACSLEEPLNCDKEYLSSSEYKNLTDTPPISELAQRFIRKARISAKKAEYVEACFDYLHAAWASDDEYDET